MSNGASRCGPRKAAAVLGLVRHVCARAYACVHRHVATAITIATTFNRCRQSRPIPSPAVITAAGINTVGVRYRSPTPLRRSKIRRIRHYAN